MNSNIVIVGAGLAGKAQALSLLQAGFSICIVDPGPTWADRATAPRDERTTAISPKAKMVLAGLGLWEGGQPDAAQAIDRMQIGAGKTLEAGLDASMTLTAAEADVDTLAWTVENDWLHRVIDAALDPYVGEGKCRYLGRHRVKDVVTGGGGRAGLSGGVSVVVQDITGHKEALTLGADLVVGADGANSIVRRLVMDDVATKADYHADALVAVLTHDSPHERTAVQVFLPDGPVALLPMTDDAQGRARSSLIWSCRAPWVKAVAALSIDEAAKAFTQRLGTLVGEVRHVEALASFPLRAVMSRRFSANGAALIADAAHGMHPLAGQGFNLGLGDIQALSEACTTAQNLGQPLGAALALEGFERRRMHEAQKLFTLTDALWRLTGRENPLVAVVQKFGFGAIDRFSGIKARLIHAAIG